MRRAASSLTSAAMVLNRATPTTSGAQSLRFNNTHNHTFTGESLTLISTTVISYDCTAVLSLRSCHLIFFGLWSANSGRLPHAMRRAASSLTSASMVLKKVTPASICAQSDLCRCTHTQSEPVRSSKVSSVFEGALNDHDQPSKS